MRVVVAMSGGVDSSVAAALLAAEGHEVVGLHFRQHDAPPAPGGRARCCGVDDALDARRVADALGIPIYVVDARSAFEEAVIRRFADDWLAGRTPNPCIECNRAVRFPVLLEHARLFGADAVATGHYARVDAAGRLHAAREATRDQSYFLYAVPREVLRRVRLPLGERTKAEVRRIAAELGLPVADKPDSQETCFVPDDDHAAAVARLRPGVDGAGEIVDESGRVLGRHDAYWRFTIGQRRGLGVALGRPVYVLRVEPGTRRVVVGDAARLFRREVLLADRNWLREPPPRARVRLRHRGPLLPCRVERGPAAGRTRLLLDEPARGPTPGQAAVLYDGDEVLGGGTIVAEGDAGAARGG